MMSLPGGTQEFTKTVYDGLGDATAVYDGYDPTNSAASYAAAGSVSGDIILTQTNTVYDAAGDQTFETDYNRLPGDTTTSGPLTASDAQVSFTAYWSDALGRNVVTANYGTASVPPSPSGRGPG